MRRTGFKRGKEPRICQACGKSFEVWHCRIGKACSDKCARELRRTSQPRICETCGTSFTTPPSQFQHYKGAGKYCSRKCSYAGIVIRAAKKPITDRWGRTKLKADKEWSKAVRERDEYICQRCGLYNKYNHAHHVATRSQRPDLKYEISNGKTLCNSCHTYVHHHPIESRAIGLLSSETYELASKQIS